MNNNRTIVVYGDPHGEYENLIAECRKGAPDAVFILGDMTKDFKETGHVTPIKEALSELLEAGIEVMWVQGNHDTDTIEHFDATFGSFPEGNIHGKVRPIASSGLRVAGLGGVFRGKIWYPEQDYEDPAQFESPEELLKSLPEEEKWRGGIPLRHHTSIFRSDAENIRTTGADILITHEAPSSREMGFMAIDQLADDAGVKVIFHGHHHEGYEDELMNGIRVRGVGMREAVRIEY